MSEYLMLLNAKFQLFEGVFGASDEILGAIESEISLEQRINEIYQKCRDTSKIDQECQQWQLDLDEVLTTKEQDARKSLLENFDEEVSTKLQGRKEKTQVYLSEYGKKLQRFCNIAIPEAEHRDEGFTYQSQDYYYYDWKQADNKDGHFVNIHLPLISNLIDNAKQKVLTPTEITFDYDSYGMQLADLRNMRGKSGWLKLSKLKIDSIDTVEKLVFSAIANDGSTLDQQQCERLMLIPATQGGPVSVDSAVLDKTHQVEQSATSLHLEKAQYLNEEYFNEE